MARRRFQEPKLHWDARLERWEVRYREDVLDSLTGKVDRVRKKAFFPKSQYATQKLAKAALVELLKPINTAEYRPTKVMTFADFAKTWVKDTLVHYKPSTQNSAAYHIRKQLVAAFGPMQLRAITAEVVQAWITKTTQAGEIGPKSIHNVFGTLRMLWLSPGGAKPLGHVTHNPCEGIKLPVVGESVTYCYSKEETMAIVFAFEGTGQDHLIVRLMAENGMRPGEVPALQVSAIDFENGKINIVKAATHNQLHSPKGKGKGKKRVLVMSDLMASDLQKHLQGRTEGLVFRETDGSMFNFKAFRENRLNKVLDRLGIREKADKMGIDRLGLYPLRHGTVTDMVAEGVDTKTRMLQVGHSKEETNLIYDHGNEAAMRAYVNARAESLVASTQGIQ